MKNESILSKAFTVANHLFLSLVLLLMALPFYYLVVNSITPDTEIFKNGYTMIPRVVSLNAYYLIFSAGSTLFKAFGITLFITVIGTLFNLAVTFFFSYSLSKRDLPGRKGIMLYLVISMLFSGGLIPWAIVIKNCGLINSIWVYIVPSLMNPFYVILVRNFFMEISESLHEAAVIDGANELRILFSIILPVSKPIIATVSLFYAVDNWNKWYEALLFINKSELFSLQYILYQLLNKVNSLQSAAVQKSGQQSMLLSSESIKFATIVMTTLPIMLVYPFLQKYFIKGIMIGSVKG